MKRIHPLYSTSGKLALLFGAVLLIMGIWFFADIYTANQTSPVHPIYVALILGLGLMICISLFYISFYVSDRINVIAETATRIIQTSDLSQRIPLDARWDDLSKLASILNSMLGEIEQLVNDIRTLSDNIAHDLRHPLTRLRNQMETMRGDALARNDPKLQQDFTRLIMECDGILSTFQAILRISNIESGKRHGGFLPLDIAQLLHDVVELYEPLATEKGITLHFATIPTRILGDKDLLFQTFTNLVDNAIKYTPAKGQVWVSAYPQNDIAHITIADSGLGISNEHKERVFNRFYRVERSRNLPGSGLGLSLVAAIIKLHNGTIALQDNIPCGLKVVVTLR